MDWTDILGFIAGAFITLAFIPQVWRLYKLKSAREISLSFSMLFLVGGICWLLWGIERHLVPVIMWNAISLVLVSAMLFAKLKYRE
ncbi:MAG: PQ-loop domain-containing transporter [Chloroflexi bacterium]|nr:PQ-loop domain-containing transporter [Chloroflexota bacterium]